MERVDALLQRVSDPQLRDELASAVAEVRRTRDFGLVFESHLPESVRLAQHPVRRGVKVARRDSTDTSAHEVISVHDGTATLLLTRHGDGTAVDLDSEPVLTEAPVEDLVVVADFGDPIYPGFSRLGSTLLGGDKPAHVVINGENHHVLEALRFTHAGKVDVAYLDPPFNSGARDWKYGNDYVDADDRYRHSKWLAFMERRLRLARDLLNPDDSALIVAIDEKEYLRLGLLLEQTFPDADVQMVTIVTNRAGSPRSGRFSRVEEYLFFVFFGAAEVRKGFSTMLADAPSETTMPNVWFSAARVGGGSALREARPALFYAVHLDSETGQLHSVSDPLPKQAPRSAHVPPDGTVAMWPLSSEGREQTWRFSAARMREYFAAGTARLGRRDPETGFRPVTYLRPGTRKNIEDGVFTITGRSEEGAVVLELAEGAAKTVAPAAVWNVTSHYARDHGSKLIANLIPDRPFPYPKSLYAVEDTLRFVVGHKPDAVVLDFFGGSGTTTHAVARLNRQDDGSRQSILITNNEVSEEEARELAAAGHRPGDCEWESLGIFEHVTRPRIDAAITGRRPDDTPIPGDYRFVDELPMAEGFEENVEYLALTYQDAALVELDLAFGAIAPLLWLRAGAVGPVLDHCVDAAGRRKPYAWTNRYAILHNPDCWQPFLERLPATVTTVYVVTDSPTQFAAIAGEMPNHVSDVVRLYERYLATFAIGGEPS